METLPVELLNWIFETLQLKSLGLLAQTNKFFNQLITNDGYYLCCKQIYCEKICMIESEKEIKSTFAGFYIVDEPLDRKKICQKYTDMLIDNFNYFTRFVLTYIDDLDLSTIFTNVCGVGKLDMAKWLYEIFPLQIKNQNVIWRAFMKTENQSDISAWICKTFFMEIINYVEKRGPRVICEFLMCPKLSAQLLNSIFTMDIETKKAFLIKPTNIK